jgi:hypothetical protein
MTAIGERPALGAQVRITTIHPYILLQQHAPDTPELMLVRVLHGAANITAEISCADTFLRSQIMTCATPI